METLSPEAVAVLLGAIAASARRRISSAGIEGRRVFIKRYDVEGAGIGRRLHALMSPVLPPVLRASPVLFGSAAAQREKRKIAAFAAAGFVVPDILYENATVLVLSDAGRTALQAMFAGEVSPDEACFVRLAAALGSAHAAGLAHGRPHSRDLLWDEGRVGFLDFEEEPEAVMPLADAQARDLWLLFLDVCNYVASPDKRDLVFQAWRQAAPKAVADALSPLLGSLRIPLFVAGLVPDRLAGSDLRRFREATRFLADAISAKDNAAGAPDRRQADENDQNGRN